MSNCPYVNEEHAPCGALESAEARIRLLTEVVRMVANRHPNPVMLCRDALEIERGDKAD